MDLLLERQRGHSAQLLCDGRVFRNRLGDFRSSLQASLTTNDDEGPETS